VLSLGLLVDDAIIAVEMMAVKMEEGLDRMKAASFAFTSTGVPMLTGHAGHGGGVPADRNGTAPAPASTPRALFQVTVDRAAGVVDRRGHRHSVSRQQAVARTFTSMRAESAGPGRPAAGSRSEESGSASRAMTRAFLVRFRRAVEWCVTYRKT
jgi:multidrug efflux pump